MRDNCNASSGFQYKIILYGYCCEIQAENYLGTDPNLPMF